MSTLQLTVGDNDEEIVQSRENFAGQGSPFFVWKVLKYVRVIVIFFQESSKFTPLCIFADKNLEFVAMHFIRFL
jgi:hypothetical protein